MEVILTNGSHSVSKRFRILRVSSIFFSFFSQERLKNRPDIILMGQLFPMILLNAVCLLDSSCAFKSRTQHGLWPINNKVCTGTKCSTFHGILHYNFRSSRGSKQNTGRTWATKSKPSIFQAGTYK